MASARRAADAASAPDAPGETALRAGAHEPLADDGKNTIASQLVDRLREAIVSGQVEAGSKINLERARERFSVSLSPLREALARRAISPSRPRIDGAVAAG